MSWVDIFINLGYVGVFLISAIGAASIFIPIPYSASYYMLGASLNPLYIAIAGGLGSAVGELSGYAAGYFGQVFIDEKQKRKMFYLMKIFDRFGPILVFLFALTPLPDDLLFIPLGISRCNFIKILIPCLVGKIIMAYILAYSGKVSFHSINMLFSESGGSTWFSTILMMILLAAITVILARIDWEKIFKHMEKE